MEAMRTAVEGVSLGLLSTAEPDGPAVVIATPQFSISSKVVSKMTEEPFECETPDGTAVQVVVTATTIPSTDPSKPIGAITMTSTAPLFPMRLAGEDTARRRQQEASGAASAAQAGASVSFSLYQEGKKLVVNDLDKPVQIMVPVSVAACSKREGFSAQCQQHSISPACCPGGLGLDGRGTLSARIGRF